MTTPTTREALAELIAAAAATVDYALEEHQPTRSTLIAAVEAARAALSAAPVLERWQPIETAPKDEKSLLLGRGNRITIGCWGDYDKYNQPKFTHWMPLPDAPKDDHA
jgi:hypothetical protein